MARAFTAIGSPLDCSGTSRGEERGPAALRAAGLLDLLGAHDLGDVHGLITGQRRDAESGVLARAGVRAAIRAVRDAVDVAYGRGASPLVLGGAAR